MEKLRVLRYREIMRHEISNTERILKVFRLAAVIPPDNEVVLISTGDVEGPGTGHRGVVR